MSLLKLGTATLNNIVRDQVFFLKLTFLASCVQFKAASARLSTVLFAIQNYHPTLSTCPPLFPKTQKLHEKEKQETRDVEAKFSLLKSSGKRVREGARLLRTLDVRT